MAFIAFAGTAMSSCSSDDHTDHPTDGTVRLQLQLPQLNTRMGLDGDTDQLVWHENDAVGLYYSTGNTTRNLKMTLKNGDANKSKGIFEPTQAAKWEANTDEHVFYAVYPYDTDIANLKVTIPETQDYAASLNDAARNMVMVGTATYTKESATADISMSTSMTLLKVVVEDGDGVFTGKGVASATLSSDKAMAGQAQYDFATQTFSGYTGTLINASFAEAVELPATFYFSVYPDQLEGAHMTLSLKGQGVDMAMDINITEEVTPGIYDIAAWEDPGQMTTDVANCYMLKPGESVFFPIANVYDYWNSEYGSSFTDEPSVKVLWIDTPGGRSKSGTIHKLQLENGDKGKEAGIYVRAGQREGNAVIAVEIEKEIRWSWHIWVTDFDPNSPANQKTSGKNTLMDRNLGAITSEAGSLGSLGLHFQWGRKDPFPHADILGKEEYPASIYNDKGKLLEFGEYDPNGNIVSEGDNDGIMYMPVPFETEAENIMHAIFNPVHFMYFLPLETGSYIDDRPGSWTTRFYMHYDDMRNDLWNDANGNKTVYDPCPAGWRVPNDIDIFIEEIGAHDEFPIHGATLSFGYVPLSGFKGHTDGLYASYGRTALIWHGVTGGYGGRCLAIFANGEIAIPGGDDHYEYDDPNFKYSKTAFFKAYGGNVRCVKE